MQVAKKIAATLVNLIRSVDVLAIFTDQDEAGEQIGSEVRLQAQLCCHPGLALFGSEFKAESLRFSPLVTRRPGLQIESLAKDATRRLQLIGRLRCTSLEQSALLKGLARLTGLDRGVVDASNTRSKWHLQGGYALTRLNTLAYRKVSNLSLYTLSRLACRYSRYS